MKIKGRKEKKREKEWYKILSESIPELTKYTKVNKVYQN